MIFYYISPEFAIIVLLKSIDLLINILTLKNKHYLASVIPRKNLSIPQRFFIVGGGGRLLKCYSHCNLFILFYFKYFSHEGSQGYCCYYIIIIKMNMISDSKFASKFELY